MKFNTFLITQIDGVFPVDKIKQDLSYFKSVFNYATKTDDLYSNLVDNIIFILKSKFGRFDIIFNSSTTMYNELMLILTPQIPQFLMIQKKQILENADTFASLNNWGENYKRNFISKINSISNGENLENYIPLDGNNKDPYSSTQNNTEKTRDLDDKVEQNVIDYLSYYSRLKWNVADIELKEILKPYYSLFKLLYTRGNFDETPTSDFNERLNKLEKEVPLIVEEVDNLENVKANKSDVYDKTESDNRYYQKSQVYNKSESDNKYYQKSEVYNKTESDNKFPNFTYLTNNHYTKTQSDNKYYQKSEVYSKSESDSRYGTFNYLNNNYYNKTDSDNRYLQKGASAPYYTKQESDNRYARDFQFTSLQTQVNQRVKLNDSQPQTITDLWLRRNIVSSDNANLLVNKRYVDENIKRLLLKGNTSMSLVDWFESGGMRYVLYKIRKPAEIDSWGRLVGINYVSYETFGFMGFTHYIKNNELYMSFYVRGGTSHTANADIYLWYVNYPSTLYEELEYKDTPSLDLPDKPLPQN